MLTVHHLNNSRSQRVLWLLEELGLSYRLVRYQRDPKTMLAPASLRAIHPLGKSPVVTDEEGHVWAESGAIVETLVERFGAGVLSPAAGSAAFERYRYWLHYAEGSAMPPLLLKLVFDRIAGARMPFFMKPVVRSVAARALQGFVLPQIRQHLDFMEAELARNVWFAGDAFSAADVQMSFPVEAAAARGGLDGSRPRLMEFLQRIHARPAYQRALASGGSFKLG